MTHTTWPAFTALIQRRREGTKDGANFIPAMFRPEPNGEVRRLAANLVNRTGLALDIETNKLTGEVPPSFEDAVSRVKAKGWAAVIYTSHSHSRAAPRYRIVSPLSAPIAPDLPAVEVLAEMLGLAGVLDLGKLGAASLFYLPSADPGHLAHHEVREIEGAPIDATWMEERAGAVLQAREDERARQRAEALEAAAKRRDERARQGFDTHTSIIELIRDRLDLAGELIKHGYEPAGGKPAGRYLYPKSESGVPGVYVLTGRDGIERVFSHHSGDPLAAGNLPTWCGGVKAVDVVDVVTILDHGADRQKALASLAEQFEIPTPKASNKRSNNGAAADAGTQEDRGDNAAPSHAAMLDHPDLNVLRLHWRPPPTLELGIFGPQWADWIATTATASAGPPAYVAAPLLSAASALIGNARWAEAWPGWAEPPHLWACAVGDSGSGKSPGADVLLRDVLPTLEQNMCVGHPETMRAWLSAAETDKAAREVWEGEVRTAHKEHHAAPLPPEAAAQHKPETPRLRQNDVTIEKVAALLASAAPQGLMIVRDEMLGWVAGMNAYHDAGRAFWIEAYGGRPYRVERQKHPEPIDIPRLVVAVFGGTQPAKVAGLLREADDGLLGRICWFWPDPVPFTKGRAAPGVTWAIEALDHLRRLELPLGNGSACSAGPLLVPLDDALHDEMVAFAQEMQARQAEAGGLMQSAYGKARGLALRLSLVLTYLRWAGDGGKGPPPARIDRAGFTAAAHLVADYLMPMAERVYGDAATRQEDRDAATLARWIVKTRPTEVHVRKMQREVRLSGLGDADAIHAAAAVLVEAGWLIPPKIGFGAARKVAYGVNPLVLSREP